MERIFLTKYIIITGGVVSSIGKGITSASMGRILRSYGLKVAAIKIDPYLNWDSGTLNPYQHGEVFVTNDGMETDLDLGHYERFLDVISLQVKFINLLFLKKGKANSWELVYRLFHILPMKLKK